MSKTQRNISSLMIALLLANSLLFYGGCADTQERDRILYTFRDDALDLPGNLVEDSKLLVQDPLNIGILLVGGGASGYVRCAQDDGIANHFEGHHTFGRDFTIAAGTLGSPVTHFSVAGAAYLYSVFAQDDQTHEVAGSLLEALSLTGIYTVGLKLIAQDQCPNDEYYAWPSGHTSSSVAVATVMYEYYGPWVGLPLYAISGFTMYERMETGEHWASDIIFGAAIGYTVGRTVAGRYRPQILGMDVMPYINPETGSTGIVLARRF
ncbi:MAG: phosphatase PAP2 family protein [Sedimentisphaerales bacterium]|nr:phosphatase PAP2 family protein [Sedimentisphaerales bacterium]